MATSIATDVSRISRWRSRRVIRKWRSISATHRQALAGTRIAYGCQMSLYASPNTKPAVTATTGTERIPPAITTMTL